LVRVGWQKRGGGLIDRSCAHSCPIKRLVVRLLLGLGEPLTVLHRLRIRLASRRR
jgi:hypothetical protein